MQLSNTIFIFYIFINWNLNSLFRQTSTILDSKILDLHVILWIIMCPEENIPLFSEAFVFEHCAMLNDRSFSSFSNCFFPSTKIFPIIFSWGTAFHSMAISQLCSLFPYWWSFRYPVAHYRIQRTALQPPHWAHIQEFFFINRYIEEGSSNDKV